MNLIQRIAGYFLLANYARYAASYYIRFNYLGAEEIHGYRNDMDNCNRYMEIFRSSASYTGYYILILQSIIPFSALENTADLHCCPIECNYSQYILQYNIGNTINNRDLEKWKRIYIVRCPIILYEGALGISIKSSGEIRINNM